MAGSILTQLRGMGVGVQDWKDNLGTAGEGEDLSMGIMHGSIHTISWMLTRLPMSV